MPYGIPKEHGGDNLENIAKMESCVKSVKAQGKSESSAVAICKSQLFPPKKKKRR